ncbi:hypothetical protein, unknown function [Leishmania infantum JPCM5]|uniref:Uncharacterized protein n=3 Tax=Leishmania donovani species complex TaxID=38574 RepID=A4I783_LEIIN|nr:hypothetical protein, unknown function [Leishmania infantum JPCM5]XP_003863373.1 hypothetical protein, unknown function [Leishmania donovani]CAC9521345.1 hypothetical_protein_-_conserved [Leishmania infantum]TPP42485.1 hypothetical protein CGC21_10850 [Leishmania donovani]CAM70664.1 hypothetical protein, unknown function [Leishmania infantum JPCM5]CBZ36685.1 hypothetical protein, unknown function [Leishmania donovani]SUZ44517.1 hypothetical_protein_-_conserved [Leishmania infantum]|eukprot:XP_001467602.1 hypothetical protein, unknown function [Leishmania infantum JPCM5]
MLSQTGGAVAVNEISQQHSTEQAMAAKEMAAENQVHVTLPEEVRERRRSRQSSQARNGSHEAPIISYGEAAPKQTVSRVLVRMPNEVRRRRSLSREARKSHTHTQLEESEMPNATPKAMPEAAAMSTAEDGRVSPEKQCPEPELPANGLAMQPAVEEAVDHEPPTEPSPAAEEAERSGRLTDAASRVEMELTGSDSAAVIEEANQEMEDNAAPHENNDAHPMIKGKEKDKHGCCIVM